ncbi:MAG: hypothetical protein P1Q69_21005 [Candidatus Thorarchaeota archaeon]|nr:hypothetical protein [Candidatus Thorarchaeota archaeon]
MNAIKADIPPDIETIRSVNGIVIGLDIGAWAGFESGRIILRNGTGTREEFYYGKNSCGVMPEIGDSVCIEYTGNVLLEVAEIRILDQPRVTITDRVSLHYSGIHLIAGRLKTAAVIAIILVLTGIGVILVGLNLGLSKPAAPFIFGVVGFSQFIIAWLIWEYSGGN